MTFPLSPSVAVILFWHLAVVDDSDLLHNAFATFHTVNVEYTSSKGQQRVVRITLLRPLWLAFNKIEDMFGAFLVETVTRRIAFLDDRVTIGAIVNSTRSSPSPSLQS